MAYITAANGSLQPAFLAIMIVLLSLSCTSVILRLYCRIALVHKVGPDEYFIVTALFVTIAMSVMNGFHISFGTGLVLFSSLLPAHWLQFHHHLQCSSRGLANKPRLVVTWLTSTYQKSSSQPSSTRTPTSSSTHSQLAWSNSASWHNTTVSSP